MKKSIYVVIGFLVGFVFTSTAIADTITIQRIPGYYLGNGGEFTIQINNDNNIPDLNFVLGFYGSKTKGIGGYSSSFQSFCVEYNEYVTPGNTYHFKISDKAIKGGVGTDTSGNPIGDPISVGTAWLYFQFATGSLTDYDYNGPPSNRDDHAKALQATIWWLEDEINTDPGNSNPFRKLVYQQFADPKANNNGKYPVRVLNLYYYDDKGNRQLAQDQLVVVPVPTTLLLLGSGLLGLVGIARRKVRN